MEFEASSSKNRKKKKKKGSSQLQCTRFIPATVRVTRAFRVPHSPARSHTRHIVDSVVFTLAFSAAPAAAVFKPYASRQALFPARIKIHLSVIGTSLLRPSAEQPELPEQPELQEQLSANMRSRGGEAQLPTKRSEPRVALRHQREVP